MIQGLHFVHRDGCEGGGGALGGRGEVGGEGELEAVSVRG